MLGDPRGSDQPPLGIFLYLTLFFFSHQAPVPGLAVLKRLPARGHPSAGLTMTLLNLARRMDGGLRAAPLGLSRTLKKE